MIEELSEKLDLLIQEKEIQPVFQMEKEITEKIASPLDINEKKEYEALLIKLYGYLIPWIPSDKFAYLMQNNLLNIMRTGTDMKEEMTLRVMPYPEDSQDVIKVEILKILLKNRETVGSRTIGQWLADYDIKAGKKKYTNIERKEFIEKNKNVKSLSIEDKQKIFEILDLYDFIKPDFEYEDYLKQETSALKALNSNTERPQAFSGTAKQIENMAINEALQQYSQVGEQLLTSNPVKLRYFPSPVRPSIKNWIEDYRQQLGAEKHGTMERGDYLYHSENARKLTPMERQKLAIVLRSLDEGTTLTIDPDRAEVIFKQQQAALNDRVMASSQLPAALPRNVDGIPKAEPEPRQAPTPVPQQTRSIPEPQYHIQDVGEREVAFNKQLRTKNLGISYEAYPLSSNREPQQSSPLSEPKIKGNVVDLRQDNKEL